VEKIEKKIESVKLCKLCDCVLFSRGYCQKHYQERYKLKGSGFVKRRSAYSKRKIKEKPTQKIKKIDYYAEGRRCSRCDRLLNEYVCDDCGKMHGKEYKNSGVCEECLFSGL
jgi:RecJ-like exonuclease